MTSIGTGYDLSASTYSPDGRIFQVFIHAIDRFVPEYPSGRVCKQSSRKLWVARPFTRCIHCLLGNFRTAIGLCVKDGIVLAVEKMVHSKLLVPGANRRIQTIDKHIGMVRNLELLPPAIY